MSEQSTTKIRQSEKPKIVDSTEGALPLVFVDKPFGWLSVDPTHRKSDDLIVARWLEAELGQKVFPCHRLDRETSGVMVFALSADSHRAINSLFEVGKVRKTYEAICHGAVPAPIFKVNSPIEGKPAITRFEILETLTASSQPRGGQFFSIQACPTTGRRHQIRIHLKEAGAPIVGDVKYGGLDRFGVEFTRFALHARKIEIPLDVNKSIHVKIVEVPLPLDMQSWKSHLRHE